MLRHLRPWSRWQPLTQATDVDISTDIELRVTRFRALADPTRLRVIDELAGGTRCVCDLRSNVGVSGPLLSHHVSVLRDSGIVTAELAEATRWARFRFPRPPAPSVTTARRGEGLGFDLFA